MEQAVVKILLLGICGYGSNYIKEISERDIPGIKIEGICEVVPNAADLYPIIKEQNIPIYQTPEDFYKEHTANLAVVSTPIHLHYSQIVTCLTHGSNVLTEKPDDEYVLKEALLNVMKIKKVDNFLEAVKHPIAKCLIVGDPTRLAVLEKEMYDHLKDRMGVFRSEPYFLELVPKGIDKALSLAGMLEKIGVSREEMIAIGDGFNDLSMIKYAGLGIAMANAQDVVKENADFITLSNEEDGVAYAAEKFILS